MAYADFAYYQGTYLGNAIREEDFGRLAVRASSFLDYYTRGRATRHPELDALKMACCAIAEKYQWIENLEALAQASLAGSAKSATETGRETVSESVGGWSQSYSTGGRSAQDAQTALNAARASLAETARTYLAATGLLYRGGCCPCECSPTL